MKRILKKDKVLVIAGKDKGKTGIVLEILHDEGKVKVSGVAIMTKHVKARKQGETSAIKKLESFIDISNVMPICPVAGKPVRVDKVQRS